MEFELTPSAPFNKQSKGSQPKAYKEATVNDKLYFVNSKVKAKHMVLVENLYGTKLGETSKGLYILATLLYEAMGTEAMTYDEMLEYDLNDLEPLLSLLT